MAIWYAGSNSTDSGNNTGWIFSAPPGGGTLSIQLDDVTISAAGSTAHTGNLNAQLDDVAITMSGSDSKTGTLSVQLDDVSFSSAGFTVSESIAGGANPWGEKARKARAITEERIRKAKADEVERIIRSLRDDGVIPEKVIEDIPDYSQVRRLYAAQLAQIAQNAAEEYERITQEEEFLIMLMID